MKIVKIMAQKTPVVLEKWWSTYYETMAAWLRVPGYFKYRCGVYSQAFLTMVVVAEREMEVPFFKDL